MGSIIFGWNNNVLDSTFVESNQAADFPVENLNNPHPSEFWRITSPAAVQNVAITFARVLPVDLRAILYSTSSPHRNFLQDGSDPTAASWIKTNVNVAANYSTVANAAGASITAPPSASVQHRIRQTYTLSGIDTETVPFAGSFYFFLDSGNDQHIEFEIAYSDSSRIFMTINTVTGAVNSSGAAGGWTLTSATTALVGSGVYRASLIGVTQNATGNDLRTTVFMLDSGFNKSFIGSGELIDVFGLNVELGTTVGAVIPGTVGAWSGWDTLGFFENADELMRPHAMTRNDEAFYSSGGRGWTHSYRKLASRIFTIRSTLFFFDPHNEAGQLDIPNIFEGPVYQPADTLKYGFEGPIVNEDGARVLRATLDNVPESEVDSEIRPMLATCGVGRVSSQKSGSYPAVEYAFGRKPVLIIIDPDDPNQNETLYGFFDSATVTATTYNTTIGSRVYRFEFTVTEVLPGG